ncbi:DHH family phosphoesterase [Romboutsia sp.]|uniref:DHH family phosphoesterase n=1 Tax=Romboutsia sp. TaxID=1965302 RepID=UPI002B6D3F8A|nr:DHH family phosphoesterase [Romboutsia sp.]HSQ88000.1 DHH family phosphoesterase [Romboutsia sp.]
MKYALRGSLHEDLVTRIFENRNVNIEQRKAFLNPSRDSIQNPAIYENMDRAFKAVKYHIETNGLILILVDSDADGYCSSATLINYFRLSLKYKNLVFVMHKDKKHGLTKEVLKEILEISPDLVIIPDAGSSDYKEHEILANNGIGVVVLDHHECEKYSDYAIVVNNQLSPEGNKTLSGGGMVLKFIEYMDTQFNIGQSEYYYDLVAVSLVADGMLMIEPETRYYVLEGLDNITNPLLELLAEKRSEGAGVFEFISYNIAPAINAIIRVGTDSDKRNLLDAMICENRTEVIKLRGQGEVELPLVEYILKMADRLKSKQTRDIKKIIEDENTIIMTENLPISIMVHENEDAQALSGLMASRLVDKYGKPSLVLRKVNQDDGRFRYDGSGRSTNTFKNFKDYLLSTDKFIYCAGHQGAFGVSIDTQKMSELLSSLLYQSLPNEDACHIVDKAYVDGRVGSMDIISIDELKQHWCRGFDKPQFYIKLSGVDSADITTMGATGNTIKITHDYISYIKFKCTQEDLDVLLKQGRKDIEIIGTFNVNEWNGRSFPQVFIEDFEVKEVDVMDDIDFNDFNAFGFGFGA